MEAIRTSDGYIKYREGQKGTWEIYDIAVTSERRMGHGTKLISLFIDQVKPHVVYAFVREENERARNFYKKLGFQEGPVRENFYEDGNAVLVIKVCE